MLQGTAQILMGGRYTCTPDWRTTGPEVVAAWRLYFPLRGSAWIETGGERTTMRPGGAYLIPGGVARSHGCPRQCVLDWLHFELIDHPWLAALRHARTVEAWDAAAVEHWRSTYRSIRSGLQNPGPAASAKLLAMLLDFVAMALERLPNDPAAMREAAMIDRLAPAIRYMNNHDTTNPPLARIAAEVHLSPERFHRLFHEAMGRTPFNFMLERRMSRAMRLLTTTQDSVAQVGEACGYANPYYFSRAFKRYFGASPRAARRGLMVPA